MDVDRDVLEVDRNAVVAELDHIAEAARILKKDRESGRLIPDYGALGRAIGRSHNALTTVVSGGEIDVRTLRLLIAYAERNVPDYTPIPLLRALRLLPDSVALTDREADQLADHMQEELGISDEALEELYRFVQTAKRLRRAVASREQIARTDTSTEPERTTAPDAR